MKVNENIKSLFLLNKNITYLNHGSFGACPKPIFEKLIEWQYLLESQPVDFLENQIEKRMFQSRKALSELINCDFNNVVLFPNPTTAMNEVIKSLSLQPGDEIITTNHEYGAIDKTWEYVCKNSGSIYKKQCITTPIVSKEQLINELFAGVNHNTKILLISHITSPTGIIFPIKEICDIAKEKKIITIVDGAHVPGHIELNINKLNVDIYVGACHKWLLCPKGVSFLYVNSLFQNLIKPLVISWGFESDQYSDTEFQNIHLWQGTNDVSNYLTIPAAINFRTQYNWGDVSNMCKQTIKDFHFMIHNEFNIQPIVTCDLNDWLGQMCTFPFPIKINDVPNMKKKMIDYYKIEIPIICWNNNIYLRISINGYNNSNDIDRLVDCLKQEHIYK